MRKFVLLLVLLLALPAAAMADDSQFIEHEPFALDDSWVEGSTRPGEYHYYPFIVEEVGLVTVRVQMFCGGHVELLDADLIEWDEGYFNGTIGAPETQDFVYYLEPGVYCLRNGSDNSQGDFRIKGIFAPCPSTETAESDDYLGAQAVPSGETLSGVLTEWDGHDFYSTLESLQPNLALYDGDMVKMSEEYGFKGYAEEFLLPAGTYYIDVWGNKGPYTLKAVYEKELPATVPAEEATEEEVDVQNESDSFDTAPEEGFTDPDSFTEELGSLLFDLLDSF